MTDFNYFIPSYPELSTSDTGEFNKNMWKRKEFHTRDAKGLAPHQRRVQRYASPVTPYDEILLFHAMGTGKTRSALAIAENALRASPDSVVKIKQVFVIGKTSRNVRLIFSAELRKMTLARLGKEELTEEEEKDLKTHLARYYRFASYATMGGMNSAAPYSIGGKSGEELKRLFNNSVFILDEVHNLTASITDGTGNTDKHMMYKRFKSLFTHNTPNRKIVLLSGTPMVNSPQDMVPLMNLILPRGDQLNLSTVAALETALAEGVGKGRISYLKESIKGDVPNAVMEGVKIAPLSKFKLVYLAMSSFQSTAYKSAAASEEFEHGDGFGIELQRLALFTFPSTGRVEDWTSNGKLNQDFWREMKSGASIDLAKVCKCSCKFAAALKSIKEGPWPVYVYSNIVQGTRYRDANNRWVNTVTGSGLKLFSLFLEQMGYRRFGNGSTADALRYMYFTSDDRPSRLALNLLNKKGFNSNGSKCRVILGSAASSEGYTFRNVKKEIVLTPHHHYSQIAQAIARGVRVGAHDHPSAGAGTVAISRLVAVPGSDSPCGTKVTSYSGNSKDIVDIVMYSRSEKKDIAIKKIERVIKTTAFDCSFNFSQNERLRAADGSRECDYGRCQYACVGLSEYAVNPGTVNMKYELPLDEMVSSTFNKYYPPPLKKKIKRIFDEVDSATFDYIANKVGGGSQLGEVLLETLADMLETREVVASRHGRPCYFWNDGDLIGLTLSVMEPAGVAARASVFYVRNPVVSTRETNEDWILKEQRDSVGEKLDLYFAKPDLLLYKPNVACSNCPNIASFPISVQETLLENSTLFMRNYEQTSVQNTQLFAVAQRVHLYYNMALFDINGKVVSALDFTFGDGALRQLEDGAWIDAEEEIKEEYLREYGGTASIRATRKKTLDANDESYGLYNYGTCNFCVVINGGTKKKKSGARGLRPGMSVCSFPAARLAAIFLQDGIELTSTMSPPPYFPWICALVPPTFSTPIAAAKASVVKKINTERGKYVNPRQWEADKLAAQMNQLSSRKNSSLASFLLLDWKEKGKVFLDTNCGKSDKARLEAAARQ